MSDLDYYTFRERTGDGRLVVPHADPNEYEFALDFVWDTAEAARGWQNENIDDLIECGDDPSEYEDLVLIHFVGEEVSA